MKTLLHTLFVILLFNANHVKAIEPVSNQEFNPKSLCLSPEPVRCNTFHLTVSVNGLIGGSIATSFDLCCVAMLWQTCFNPKEAPGNYGYNLYLDKWNTSITKEVDTKGIKEIKIEKCDVVEIEKSLYTIQISHYPILKDNKGKYIEVILEKVLK